MEPFTPAFDELVESTLARWHVPGVSLAVVDKDKSWAKGYGIAKLPSTPVIPSTIFYSGSTTKAQLCAAWAIFIKSTQNKAADSSKRINWSTPLSHIIRDDFVLQDAHAINSITLEDTLSHRTGMPRHELSYGRAGVMTAKEIVRNLRNLPLKTELRTEWEYCNIMYIAASYALEVAYGAQFETCLRELVWEPLGMGSTFGGLEDAKMSGSNVANGYLWSAIYRGGDHVGGEYIDEGQQVLSGIDGAGAAMSTAEDYATYMRALLNGSGPLTAELVSELWTPRAILPPEDQNEYPYESTIVYCLGWFKAMYRGHEIIYHEGDLHGFGAGILLLPKLKFGVSYFGNAARSAVTIKGLAFELVDEFLKVPKGETCREKIENNARASFAKAGQGVPKVEVLYPELLGAKTIPLALDIAAYIGSYTSPGYGTLTFTVGHDDDGYMLYAYVDHVFDREMSLRHVNADSWYGLNWYKVTPVRSFKARSRVGVDGRVEGFEITVEPSMPEMMMWFARDE